MPDYIPPTLSDDVAIHEDLGDTVDGPIIYPIRLEKLRPFDRNDFETEEIERLQTKIDDLMKGILEQAAQVKRASDHLQIARAVIKAFVYPTAIMTEQQQAEYTRWLEVENRLR